MSKKPTYGKALALTFGFLLYSFFGIGQVVFDGDNCEPYGTANVTDGDDVSSDPSDLLNFWASAQRDAGIDYLYLTFSRVSSGAAGFTFYINTDCDINTGDPANQGSDYLLLFGIKKVGGVFAVTNSDIYNYSGGSYVDSLVDFEALIGESNCLDPTSEGEFIELRIPLSSFFDPCQSVCNSFTIENVYSSASPSINSSSIDSFSSSVPIGINSPPVANFPHPINHCTGEEVSFSGLVSTYYDSSTYTILTAPDSNDTLVSYEWDFDYDGITFNTDQTGAITNYTFLSSGTYTIALRVTDSFGCTDLKQYDITIFDNLTPLYTYSALAACYTVDFNSSTTIDPTGGDNLIFEWDFSYDNATFNVDATGATLKYTFPGCGSYQVALRVTDPDGTGLCQPAILTKTVSVTETEAPTWITTANSLNVTLECSDTTGLNTALAIAPTASDNCDTSPTITKTTGAFVADVSCTFNGTYTNTWTSTDNCGNTSAVFTQVITIQDTTAPTWASAVNSLDINLDCNDSNGLTNAMALEPISTDSCDASTNIIKTTGAFVADVSCTSNGTYTNTWTSTDVCGNISTVFTQVITIQDTTAPTWTSTTNSLDITIECDDTTGLNAAMALIPISNDICDVSPIINKTTGTFVPDVSCASNGTYTNIWTSTDACGNISAVFTQVITIQDTTAPIWTSAPNNLDVTIECDDTTGLNTAMALTPISSDNCDTTPNIVKTTGAFVADASCASNGTYTNTWTSTDACGNTSTVFTQVITVQDTTAPTWTTTANSLNITLECDNTTGLNVAMAFVPVSNDNCDGTPVLSKTTGTFVADASCASNGTYTNTWTSTDACGNISTVFTQIITLQDTTAPTWTSAANSLDVTVECDDTAGLNAAMAVVPVSNDNCDSTPVLTKTTGAFVADASCASNGTYTNTWISTDACGNISSVFTQVITLQDTTAPTWTSTANSLDVTLECDDTTGLNTALALAPVSNDNCDVTPNMVKTTGAFVADISCVSNGTYTNTWISTDACGNISTVFIQVITIQDTTAPIWTSTTNSLDVTIECDNSHGLNSAMALIPVSNDNCDALPALTKTTGTFVADASCASNGTYTNTWTSTDACGNISTVFTQIITLQDTTAPTWTTTANNLNVTLECDDTIGLNEAMALVPVSNDNCDGTPVLSKTTGTFVADASCASNGTYTNTWTSTDACGNISTVFTQVITIQDTTAPTWTTIANSLDVTLECDDTAGLNTAIALAPVSSDNCDALPALTKITGVFVADASCVSNGTYTNTWTSIDACGNISTVFTQVITLQDTTAPTWTSTANSLDITIECDDTTGLNAAMALVPVSGDNCDALPALTKTTGAFVADASCVSNGTYTNTWTSTDACGNISTVFIQVITIQDTTSPIWTSTTNSLNVTIECNDTTGLNAALALVPVSDDNCDALPALTKTTGLFVTDASCASNGTFTNTWTSTDACGNISTVFTQVITVQDTTAPTWTTTANNLNVTLECDDTIGLNEAMALLPVSNDNCDASPNMVKTTGTFVADASCASNGTYTNTWISTDACGNTSTVFTQVITIQDTTAPTWTTIANSLDVTLECDDTAGLNTAMALVPVSGDNCDALPALTKTTGAFVADASCVSNGTYTNTWTSTDACGNISTVFTQVITLQDTTAPTWTSTVNSLDVTIECDDTAGLNAALALVPVSNDNCDALPALSKTTGSFVADISCASNGTYTNTWTSTDACGNISTIFIQVITIQDTTAPIWTSTTNSLNVTIECNDTAGLNAALALVPVSDDNCDALPPLTKTTGAFVADASCASNGTYTNTWTSTDACGNISTVFTQIITVQDTTAPTWTTTANNLNVTLECDDTIGLNEAMTLVPVSNDNCDVSPNMVKTTGLFVADASCTSNGTYTNTWTSTDACGNISTVFTQVISIQDTTGPTGIAPSDILELSCLDDIPDADINSVMNVSDNCSSQVIITVSDSNNGGSGCSGDPFILTRTYTLRDECNNITNIVQIIRAESIIAPNAGIDTSATLCLNDDPVDLFYLLVGNPDTGGTWFPALESGTNIFDPTIDLAGDYIYTVVGDCICADAYSTLTVSINEAPIITGIEVNDCDEDNSIIIYAEGINSGSLYDISNFEYSIDGGFTYQDENIFENVTPGAHTIMVRDKYGCGLDTYPTEIIVVGIDAPDYFTPNGDSYHDTWHIKNTQDFPDAKIYIFDRFGKLITQLHSDSEGWDGTFQGKLLPATDYWYQIELLCSQGNSVAKKGHFSLKR